MGLLCITRRFGERVRLSYPDGTVVWVTVEAHGRGDVRLTFKAPQTVRIMREELLTDNTATELVNNNHTNNPETVPTTSQPQRQPCPKS